MKDLPNEIFHYVCVFLIPLEVINLAMTCKKIRDILDLAIIDDRFSHQLKDQHWRGDIYTGDREKLWFRFMPLFLQDYVHSIQFIAECHDQGWGNRKGRVFIREDKNENNYRGLCVASSENLEHNPTLMKLEFTPKRGKNYTLCYVEGGGGGHEIFLKKPQIRLFIYKSHGMGPIATIFRNEVFQSILNCSFGINMMIAAIDGLINCIESDQRQDKNVVLSFSSIGVDTKDVKKLKKMREFLTKVPYRKHS